MVRKLPVTMHVHLYLGTGFVCHSFWREYLTRKRCTCQQATGMGSPVAGLAAVSTEVLVALFVEGLARGLALFRASLAQGLQWQAIHPRNIPHEVQFFCWPKHLPIPYTMHTLCPYNFNDTCHCRCLFQHHLVNHFRQVATTKRQNLWHLVRKTKAKITKRQPGTTCTRLLYPVKN